MSDEYSIISYQENENDSAEDEDDTIFITQSSTVQVFYQIQFERETNKNIEESNQWKIYQLYQIIEEIRINNVHSEWELQQKIYNLQYELRKINETRRRKQQFL